MRKKIVCLTLALLMTVTPAVGVSASREDDLRAEQAQTNDALNAAYTRIDELMGAKQQLESEISTLDANLVQVMSTIKVLEGEIANKEAEIVKTKVDLGKAQKAKEKQYEAMKKRIQYLYEKGGSDAWFQMMLKADNLADLLNRAEYTQKLYEQDRQSLQKYSNTIEEVKKLEAKYQQDKGELEEMKNSYQQESQNLNNQIADKKATSANFDGELAQVQDMANQYVAILQQQQAEIERLEAERAKAEEEERIAREKAAQQAASQGNNEASGNEETGSSESNGEGNNQGSSEENNKATETKYDEYGNVIDAENTVSHDSGDSGAASSEENSVVDYAKQFVGNPYVWGGTSLTNGADCSGFVQSVYAKFGVNLPRTSWEQMNVGKEVPYSEARAGDLICYGGHIGIYMGDGKIVHASNSAPYPQGGIKISNNAAYRQIMSVRRVI